jgi:endoglucanase
MRDRLPEFQYLRSGGCQKGWTFMKRIFPVVILVLICTHVRASSPTTDIKVDQVGYLPGARKVALVVSQSVAKDFTIRRAGDGSVAYRGTLAPPVSDADTGDRVQAADFTRLAVQGKYYIDVPGVGRSWDFSIAPDAYAHAYYLAMRSFYGQRCGIAVDLGPEFPGYTHDICHLKGAYHQSSGRTGAAGSAGGWHDAGDYGRYMVNSGITTGTLLWTWELFGSRVRAMKLNIPESGNGTPDLLNELRWNLIWMLSMQDQDGGVWHKQTSERFCDFIMPEKDTLTSYLIGTGKEPYKSSCATADFTAVMAIAARAFKTFDPSYSRKCLQAARRAWGWLEKYPDVQFHNPPGVSTGGYGDNDCSDERLWASAELWRTTGEKTYESYFLSHYRDYLETLKTVAGEGWAHLAPMALWTYALGGGKDSDAVGAIRQQSISAADQIVERSARNGYRISMTSKDYVWGSNAVVANYGMQLLITNALRPNALYVQTALEDLHYLLGRNTFSLSWVTQVGANPFRHPHHRPSGADKNAEPWPGLLSGGPNQGRQDPVTKKLPELAPAKLYLDEEASYASNETAINWNAPLVFLLAGVLPEK